VINGQDFQFHPLRELNVKKHVGANRILGKGCIFAIVVSIQQFYWCTPTRLFAITKIKWEHDVSDIVFPPFESGLVSGSLSLP